MVIGISMRTTNENGQAAQDIPALWNQFLSGQIASRILNKIGNDVYCIYTDYEKDHTKPYTTILGCKVSSLAVIPEGLVGKTIHTGKYFLETAKGNILQGIVFDAWVRIWNAGLPRTFTADFEVYGDKTKNPENGEVDIFIAVK